MNEALQRKIELLIDGELSPDDEARLLSRIDGDCDAWKQLGMTFLEDRLIRRALASPAPARAAVSVKVDPPRPHVRGRIAWLGTAAVVACAAFVTGRMSAPTEPAGDSISIAENTSHESGATVPQPIVPPAANEKDPEEGIPEATEFVSMELVGSDDVSLQRVYVPLLEADRYQKEVASRNPSGNKRLVDDRIRRVLAAQGRSVDERLTLVPIRLDDGRTGVIPITNIEVRPSRLPAIQ